MNAYSCMKNAPDMTQEHFSIFCYGSFFVPYHQSSEKILTEIAIEKAT